MVCSTLVAVAAVCSKLWSGCIGDQEARLIVRVLHFTAGWCRHLNRMLETDNRRLPGHAVHWSYKSRTWHGFTKRHLHQAV
jgi:hypothetical protein